MLFTILAFIVALGLLVTFHELGHYSIARLCKVKIIRFSIGFGPVLWQRQDKHGTQWALSALPLGGYVKMLDDAPLDADLAIKKSAFNNKKLSQRFAIVAAGPIANLLLAVVIFAVVGLWGSYQAAPILAQPGSNSAAALAGINAGDEILAVNNKPVESWLQARWQITDSILSDQSFGLSLKHSNGETADVNIVATAITLDNQDQDPLAELGLSLYQADPYIGEIQANSPADAAGLLAGDKIIAIDGIHNPNASQFIERVQASAGQTISLGILRNDTNLLIDITPAATKLENGDNIGRIGAMVQAQRKLVLVKSGLFDSINTGFQRTADLSIMSVRMLGHMLTGQASIKNLSGPVTIAQYAGNSARVGVQSYLNFLALISISIGILNLLPIPMLDGGHLLFYMLEALRGGKPIPVNIQQFSLKIGFSIVMFFMFIALFNDFERLFM